MTNSLGKSARPANGLKLLPTKCVPKVKSITGNWERTNFSHECCYILDTVFMVSGYSNTHCILGQDLSLVPPSYTFLVGSASL